MYKVPGRAAPASFPQAPLWAFAGDPTQANSGKNILPALSMGSIPQVFIVIDAVMFSQIVFSQQLGVIRQLILQ